MSSTTRREAEWDEEQAGWMLALQVYRSHVHKDCGGYLPDTTDPAAEDRYEPAPPVRCHLCTARARAHQAFTENKGAHPEAMLWPVKRRE